MECEGRRLTHGDLHRCAYPGPLCTVMSVPGNELERFVGFPEDFFYVQALDCGVAVFDEEGVRLPLFRVGAAVCCCEIPERTKVQGQIEGSSDC